MGRRGSSLRRWIMADPYGRERTYFAVPYRLDGSTRYFIWYSDEKDGVLLIDSERLATFSSISDVDGFLSRGGLVLDPEECSVYDFDSIARWLSDPKGGTLDCESMLNAVNMFTDIAHSTFGAMDEDNEFSVIYDKLFWGSNIPAVTPEGEHFIPVWSSDEIAVLARVLSVGLSGFRKLAGFAA